MPGSKHFLVSVSPSCAHTQLYMFDFDQSDSGHIVECSSLSSKPCLSSHKLLIWPPYGAVWTKDLSLIPTFIWEQFDAISLLVNECVLLLILTVLFRINQSFAPLLCCSLWGKHGEHCSVIFFARDTNCDVLIGWGARILDNPEPSIESNKDLCLCYIMCFSGIGWGGLGWGGPVYKLFRTKTRCEENQLQQSRATRA